MSFERSWVEIDLDNFKHNLCELKKLLPPHTGFMQVVKADAYGHGAYEIALQSIKLGAEYLGVANVEEGALLRFQNITAPILILSPSFPEEIDSIIEYSLTPTVSTLDFATLLNERAGSADSKQAAKTGVPLDDKKEVNNRIRIQLEIDTGMGRSGIRYDTAEKIIRDIAALPNLEIEGIFSHFSSTESDIDYTLLQSKRFREILNNVPLPLKHIHISNSAGIITCTPDYTNIVRIGLLSYGVYPDEKLKEKIDLRPVMTFKSSICQIKTALRGETIGYNRSFTAQRNTRYAVIPVGYADGYDFLLSNRGKVQINYFSQKEKERVSKPKTALCPVIGRISMDMITVDVTEYSDIQNGDEVILLNSGDLRSEKIVTLYDGLTYELLSQIGRRARRYYHRNNEIVATSPLSRRGFVPHDFSDRKLNLIIESAISQRLQSKEIASLLYREILRRFFIDKDDNIHYRKNFRHYIAFREPEEPELLTPSTFDQRKGNTGINPSAGLKNYYEVETTLTFTKVLQQSYFYVACAKRIEDLERYFRRRDVEYRWLLDDNFTFDETYFEVTAVSINGLLLNHTKELNNGCMEIRCSLPDLTKYVGKEVDFSISTKTYYPKASRQLSVYITEITKGVEIGFSFPSDKISNVEVVNIFSGQSKYPKIKTGKAQIEIDAGKDEWVFPNSGVVFVYGT